MTPHPPTFADIPALAALHAQAWRETYPGLLPEDDIARMTDPAQLHRIWAAVLGRGDARAVWLPGQGFAVIGPQRDAALAGAGYPEELWMTYLLRAAQGRGVGRALLSAVRSASAFTALVVAGNTRACGFYAAQGGILLDTRAERIGTTPITERVYGWPEAVAGA